VQLFGYDIKHNPSPKTSARKFRTDKKFLGGRPLANEKPPPGIITIGRKGNENFFHIKLVTEKITYSKY
jgi:hypothetical protein